MEKILVLDFGGQYNQLIARRVRDFGVYSEILSYEEDIQKIKDGNYKGIIFTGGPNSVYDMESPHYTKEVLELGIPVLGICYGSQLIAWMEDGEVATAPVSEYGKIELNADLNSVIFKDVPEKSIVWMSHTDYIAKAPAGYKITGTTNDCPCAAMENAEKGIYAVQFHPEVTHSQFGSQMLKNFVFDVCGCAGDWKMDTFIENTVADLRQLIGDKKVVLGLSGGVDSSVAAGLLSKAIGKNLICVFVDQGLMRKDEGDFVEQTFTKLFDMNFVRINCGHEFIGKLKGVTDPEKKRKIIGKEFYRVFWRKIAEINGVELDESELDKDNDDGVDIENIQYNPNSDVFFAQGTIYPDTIESGKGKADTIKTHHNRVKMPKSVHEAIAGIIEPLKELFKDEVRAVGEKLGIPKELVWRQPFPGPGLGVRIIGEITEEKVKILQDADAIFREEMATTGYESNLSQFFAVLPNVMTVGVMGDHRTYDHLVALRAVTTDNFMTADWAQIPYDLLAKVSNRITNEVEHVNRVVYDITSKPPGTVEWE